MGMTIPQRSIWTAGVMALAINSISPALQAAAGAPDSVSIDATGRVSGKPYEFHGYGQCHYSSDASIYGMPATMWSASLMPGQATSDRSHLNVAIWQPTKGGSPQVTLSVQLGPNVYALSTVAGSNISGSATARAEKRGSGGTLHVDARTATGQPITVSISCSRFLAPEDNG
jgi:hypothetical protein